MTARNALLRGAAVVTRSSRDQPSADVTGDIDRRHAPAPPLTRPRLKGTRAFGRLVAKGLWFAVSLAALLLGLESVLTSLTSWKRYEDPRARILWDGAFDGSRVVLIGGSAFASIYVDSLQHTVWARLESYSGERVFPGALNGARPPDFLAAAIHVSREWPPGTTVFIGVPPTLFTMSRVPDPPAGNFADAFFRRYGIDVTNRGAVRVLEGEIQRRVLSPFFAFRTRSALANLIDRPHQPGWMHHRVWSEEEHPKQLFEFYEQHLIMNKAGRPFSWLEAVRQELQAAGMHSVIVLTPLNEPLVRSFARIYPADSILRYLRGNVAAARARLEQEGAPVIDLTDAVSTECFFDLVHVNTCGDEVMARRLAAWLDSHGKRARSHQP